MHANPFTGIEAGQTAQRTDRHVQPSKETVMKKLSVVAIALSTLVAGQVFAADASVAKTREQVRAEVIAAEPFCRKCLEQGKRVKTDVVDHVVPLAWGGSDSRGNKQGLCDPCHDEKSKAERLVGRRGRGRVNP